MAAFNPWAGFGQQQFPPGFGGFGGVPMGGPQFWGPDQGMQQVPPGFGGGPQFLGPDQGMNQVPPGAFGGAPPQGGGGPQLGGVGGAPVGGGGSQYPDWFVQAGQQNGMNPRQMQVEWQRFMQNQGGGGRQPDMGGGGPQGPFTQQAPPMYAGTPGETRGGGIQGGKFGGGPQLGMIGGAPVSDRAASGRMLSEGKSNAAPSGQAAGSGKWQYHANGSRTWKPNKPKPAAKPPVVVKPGPGGGPTTQGNTSTRPYETDPPQPNPTISANDVVKPGGTQTPPIYVPGSDMKQSSGSMPSLAASLNKRRPGQ